MGKPTTNKQTTEAGVIFTPETEVLTSEQWISRITEQANTFNATETAAQKIGEQWEQDFTALCIDIYRALVTEAVSLGDLYGVILDKEGNKVAKNTITNYELIGGAMLLPGTSEAKKIVYKGDTLYNVESVKHIRTVVVEARNRKVKVGKDVVTVGHTADHIRECAGTAADRASFIAMLKAKSAAQVRAEAKAEKIAAAEADDEVILMSDLLLQCNTLLKKADEAVLNSEVDKIHAATMLANIRRLFPAVWDEAAKVPATTA